MKKIKLLSMICLMVMLQTSINAKDITSHGFIFKITSSKTMKVTGVINTRSENIVIPDSVEFRERKFAVTEIEREALASLTDITKLKIPETVTKIGDNPFGNGAKCIELTLPSKLQEIPTGCFSGFSSIKTIKLPDSLRVIGNYAFSDCSSLTSITIPELVTTIREGAFKSCKSLSKLTLPASVQVIGSKAFKMCEKLTSITFTGKIIGLGSEAFYGCKALEEIILPDGVTEIGFNTFENCASLKHIHMPNSVTRIGQGAFIGCESLEEIVLPTGINVVSVDVFNGCKNIQTLTIPENVVGIGTGVIAGCRSLKQLVLRPKDIIFIEDGVFSQQAYDNVELVVPTGMSQQYQQAEGWRNFKTISEQEMTDRRIAVTLRVDPFGSVKVDGQVYEAGTWYITLPANESVNFEVATDETHAISRAEHQREWGVDQYSEEVKNGTLTIPQISNGDSFTFQFENGAADIDILQTNKGKVTVHARKNQRYRFMVIPEEGWQINSVTWNGEDMTSQIKPNSYIETPVVIANSVLQIAVEKASSAIPPLSPSRLKVYAQGENLYIENAEEGETINIYRIDGTLLKTFTGNGATLSTTLKKNHVYLIKAKQKTVKILL